MGETTNPILFKGPGPLRGGPFYLELSKDANPSAVSEAGFLAIGPILARLTPIAASFLGAVSRRFLSSAQTFLKGAWTGISTKLSELSRAAYTSLTSASYWSRFGKIGAASAALRSAYDLADRKERSQIRHNALLAFLGGGLCGGLNPKIPVAPSAFAKRWLTPALGTALPYNYVALDILGDFSKDYLVDIRDKHGDKTGIAMASGLLAAENGLAAVAFLPFLGTWTKAAKTAMTVTTLSIGMETYLQRDGGREWRDIDPGRFVGMSAWGHSIVVLPEAILGGAVKAAGLTQAFGRTTELGVKYIIFVNPSVNNFSAKINNQNWKNVQMGNTARHATAMWAARFIQSTLGPSHPLSMVVDEGLGTATIAVFNEIWPFYEGVPGFRH